MTKQVHQTLVFLRFFLQVAKIFLFFPDCEKHLRPPTNHPVLPGVELMSRGLWTESSDQIWNGIRKVDLRPNYGDSGCLELKAGDGEGASGSSTD